MNESVTNPDMCPFIAQDPGWQQSLEWRNERQCLVCPEPAMGILVVLFGWDAWDGMLGMGWDA